MSRSTLFLATITLICGAALGWTGALILGQFWAAPQAEESHTVATSPTSPSDTNQSTKLTPDSSTGDMVPTLPVASPERPVSQIAVSVNGAVRRPGVYTFNEGERVKHGIRAAGGAIEEADLSDINIAARLTDNTSLYIPFQMFRHQEGQSLMARRTQTATESNPARYTRSGWAQTIQPATIAQQDTTQDSTKQQAIPPAATTSSGLINLNTATLEELQKLPGIGPKTAEKIDAYRKGQPFQTIEQLEAVSGIGPKTMESVRNLITVN